MMTKEEYIKLLEAENIEIKDLITLLLGDQELRPSAHDLLNNKIFNKSIEKDKNFILGTICGDI